MNGFDKELISGFINETRSYLPKILNLIGSYHHDSSQVNTINEVSGMMHTIKGASSMLGLSFLARVSDKAAKAIEEIKAGRVDLSPKSALFFRNVVDSIELYLSHITSGREDEEFAHSDMLNRVDEFYKNILNNSPVETFESPQASPENSPEIPVSYDLDEDSDVFDDRLSKEDLSEDIQYPPKAAHEYLSDKEHDPFPPPDTIEIAAHSLGVEQNVYKKSEEAPFPSLAGSNLGEAANNEYGPEKTKDIMSSSATSSEDLYDEIFHGNWVKEEDLDTSEDKPSAEAEPDEDLNKQNGIDSSLELTKNIFSSGSSEVTAENNLTESNLPENNLMGQGDGKEEALLEAPVTEETQEDTRPIGFTTPISTGPISPEPIPPEPIPTAKPANESGAGDGQSESGDQLISSDPDDTSSIFISSKAQQGVESEADELSGILTQQVISPEGLASDSEQNNQDIEGETPKAPPRIPQDETPDSASIDKTYLSQIHENTIASEATFEQTSPRNLDSENARESLPESNEVNLNASSSDDLGDDLTSDSSSAFDEDEDFEDEIPPELFEIFSIEADEHLVTISSTLSVLDKNLDDRESLQELRRAVHTLKGAASIVGFNKIAQFSHRMEDLLDQLYEGERALTPELIRLLFSSSDVLEDIVGDNLAEDDLEQTLTELYASYDEIFNPPIAPIESNTEPEPEQETRLETGPQIESYIEPEIESEMESRPEPEPELDPSYEPAPQPPIPDAFSEPYPEQAIQSLGESGAEAEDLIPREEIEQEPIVLEAPPEMLQATNDSSPDIDLQPGTMEEEPKAPNVPNAEGEPTETRAAIAGSFVRIPIERLDEIINLVGELVVNRSTFEQYYGGLEQEVKELRGSTEKLSQVASGIDTQLDVMSYTGSTSGHEKQAVGMSEQLPQTSSTLEFDELEFDRYNELHLFTGDLAETISDIGTINNELGHVIGDFDGYKHKQDRLTSDIQDKLMRLRLVPFSILATRLQRAVRVTAQKQNKRVDLIIEGENVELDKTLLEEMADPLLHILRNSVDHGIELPYIRKNSLHKPERGSISIKVFYEGTQVVIKISDDGAGIDPELIRSAAVKGGHIDKADASALSDNDLYSLLFIPGFSTAEEISEISGRGVGMDVVSSVVQKLKGTVSLDSVPGQGAAFTVRLPMTLALTRVFMVKAHGETLAVPAGAVSRIERIEPEEIETVANKTVLRLDGEVYPLIRLGESLNFQSASEEPETKIPVLIVNSAGEQFAITVDVLLEGREVVVKNLGNHLRRIHGVSGATIMGDGGVVLIINPDDLVRDSTLKKFHFDVHEFAAKEVDEKLQVLIVDDSLSVRRILSGTIRQAGWEPFTAKDGIDALEHIQQSDKLPDILLLDLEMPRMDGYELTSAIRSDDSIKHIPIVIITSRAGEMHRNKAFELGVDEYLVKPYQVDQLYEVVERLTSKDEHDV